ncbi:hypothetical protein ACJX0J_036282, partial [Zea mays]
VTGKNVIGFEDENGDALHLNHKRSGTGKYNHKAYYIQFWFMGFLMYSALNKCYSFRGDKIL